MGEAERMDERRRWDGVLLVDAFGEDNILSFGLHSNRGEEGKGDRVGDGIGGPRRPEVNCINGQSLFHTLDYIEMYQTRVSIPWS